METTNLNPAKGLQTIRKANIWAIIAVALAVIGGVILTIVGWISIT